MNLRDQLSEILPSILPVESSSAVKGTELISLVKSRLQQSYSDATLRYHFSILSRDPASPIAKVERGQGYYRRSARSRLEGAGEVVRMTQALLLDEDSGVVERELGRARRMRVLFARHADRQGHSPVLFTHNQRGGTEKEALWLYPDAALVEWDLGAGGTNGQSSAGLDENLIRIKASLGASPFRMTAIKFLLDAETSDFREAFFQCLCNSRWAHRGELVVAARIDDEFIAETLARLGHEHGIGVSSLGLTPEQMDEWPDAGRLADMNGPELEAILKAIEPQTICEGKSRPSLDWDDLGVLREDNENFEKLLEWISACLEAGAPQPFLNNAELG